MKKSKLTFTEKQKECTEDIKHSLAILAGAGSGKTAVLIERIKNIVSKKAASLNDIVAITFTEKAAGELIYRLTEEISPELRTQVDQATITTIHGFCTKILREDAALIGINPDFKILEEHASRIMIHRTVSTLLKEMLKSGNPDAGCIVEEMEYRYAVGCLEDLIEERWHVKRWNDSKSIEDARSSELKRSLINCFKEILETIEDKKREMGILNFADLEIKTLELLQNFPEVKKKYQNRIKHLLIDEYQDTSDLQTEIVKEIFNPKKNILCIVGDPGQSIYRFRGANPEGIHEIRNMIESSGGKTVELTDNFRSAKPVLEFVNNLFGPHVIASPLDKSISGSRLLRSARNDIRVNNNHFLPLTSKGESLTTSKVLKLNLETAGLKSEEIRENEAAAIAAFIGNSIKENRNNYGDYALLFRSFTDIGIYERALSNGGIPFYRSGGRTFLNQPEVADIILCLKVLEDPSDDTLAYGLARSTIVGLNDQECYRLFSMKEKGKITESLPLGRLKKVKDYLSVPELIREIVTETDLFKVFELIQPSGQPTANIEKLVCLAETICTQYDYSLREFLDYIDDLKMRGIGIGEPPIFSPRDDAVKLLTIHAAKGLEFNSVILADLLRFDRIYKLPYIIDNHNGIGFKLRKAGNPIADKEKTESFQDISELDKEKDLMEKERLLYVAVTRAKERLIIPSYGKTRSKSSWLQIIEGTLDNLEPAELKILTDGKREMRRLKSPLLLKETPETRKNMTVSHLESYYRCPQEFYLKYMLKVPSEKIEPRSDKMGANTIGNIVHKSIQIEASTDKEWKDILPAVCKEYSYPEPEEKDLKKINDHLLNYENSEYYDQKLKNAKHETPFIFTANDTDIRGTIDLIFEDDGGFSIVDFKTDKVNSEDDINVKTEEYRLQIMAYAIAAKRALKKDIKKIALLFLQRGEIREISMGESDFSKGNELIESITDSIRKGDFDIKDKETPCNKCPYHHNKTCWLDKIKPSTSSG